MLLRSSLGGDGGFVGGISFLLRHCFMQLCACLYTCVLSVAHPSLQTSGGLENKTRPHTLCLVVRQCASPSLSCARLSVASIPRCARQPVAFPHFCRYQNCFCLWGEKYILVFMTSCSLSSGITLICPGSRTKKGRGLWMDFGAVHHSVLVD